MILIPVEKYNLLKRRMEEKTCPPPNTEDLNTAHTSGNEENPPKRIQTIVVESVDRNPVQQFQDSSQTTEVLPSNSLHTHRKTHQIVQQPIRRGHRNKPPKPKRLSWIRL